MLRFTTKRLASWAKPRRLKVYPKFVLSDESYWRSMRPAKQSGIGPALKKATSKRTFTSVEKTIEAAQAGDKIVLFQGHHEVERKDLKFRTGYVQVVAHKTSDPKKTLLRVPFGNHPIIVSAQNGPISFQDMTFFMWIGHYSSTDCAAITVRNGGTAIMSNCIVKTHYTGVDVLTGGTLKAYGCTLAHGQCRASVIFHSKSTGRFQGCTIKGHTWRPGCGRSDHGERVGSSFGTGIDAESSSDVSINSCSFRDCTENFKGPVRNIDSPSACNSH